MRFSLIALFLLSLPALAQVSPTFKNDREGDSYFLGRKNIKAGKKVLKSVTRVQVMNAWREVLNETTNAKLCAYSVNEALLKKIQLIDPEVESLPGILTVLRNTGDIDDVVVEILRDADDVTTSPGRIPPEDEYDNTERNLPDDLDAKIALIKDFKITKCLDEDFPSLYKRLDLYDRELEALLIYAYKKKEIDLKAYQLLEKSREFDLQESGLTLRDYHKKRTYLRLQYPLANGSERSEFVSSQFSKKVKDGRRLRLMRGYSEIQIILMANVIKKLRERLESPRVEILVYNHAALVEETIPLEPMEQFRFAVKILRKEMANLALNSYFNGAAPEYMDLLTAAFETGLIPAAELDEVAGLEEIWNPKKTFWDKASVWVRTFSSIATVTIPPPYGFIPTLALVIIEATVGKKKETSNEASLF